MRQTIEMAKSRHKQENKNCTMITVITIRTPITVNKSNNNNSRKKELLKKQKQKQVLDRTDRL